MRNAKEIYMHIIRYQSILNNSLRFYPIASNRSIYEVAEYLPPSIDRGRSSQTLELIFLNWASICLSLCFSPAFSLAYTWHLCSRVSMYSFLLRRDSCADNLFLIFLLTILSASSSPLERGSLEGIEYPSWISVLFSSADSCTCPDPRGSCSVMRRWWRAISCIFDLVRIWRRW